MYLPEDLWIKISEDFHTEINSILEQLSSTSKQNYWFDKKSISGKFFIINNVLLALNGRELNLYKLTKLMNTLEAYKIKVSRYLESHDIATCFVFFAPEINTSTKNYFDRINEYSISFSKIVRIGTLYQIGMEIIGFPNTCSYKLTASISNNEIVIRRNNDPIHPNEMDKGKQISNSKRSSIEQRKIENQLKWQNPELREKGEIHALQNFTDFAKKTHQLNIALLDDFDRCIVLCNSIMDKKQKDSNIAKLQEIEGLYSVLINGYVEEPFKKFREIFNSDYSGDKIIWLKSGPELKYFIDRLNDKFSLSNMINQWAETRIELHKPIKKLSVYLRKQTSRDEYLLLTKGNIRKNPLYRFFRE